MTGVLENPAPNDWIPLKGRRSIDLYVESAEIDASHMDTLANWAEYIAGRKGARFAGELAYFETDPGQAILIENAFGEGTLKIKLRLAGDVGEYIYIGDAFVKTFDPAGKDEDVQLVSVEIRVTDSLDVHRPAWYADTDLDSTADVGLTEQELGSPDGAGLGFYVLLFGEPNA